MEEVVTEEVIMVDMGADLMEDLTMEEDMGDLTMAEDMGVGGAAIQVVMEEDITDEDLLQFQYSVELFFLCLRS